MLFVKLDKYIVKNNYVFFFLKQLKYQISWHGPIVPNSSVYHNGNDNLDRKDGYFPEIPFRK